jgi:hypothetical protein
MTPTRLSLLALCLLTLLAAVPALCDGGPAAPQPAAKPAAKPAADGWITLFDGKTMDGWEPTGDAAWSVKYGALIGQQGPGGTTGDIYTKDEYKDFELILKFRMMWPGNSGIWFRSKPGQALGYQLDILDLKEYGCTVGTIYSDGFLSQNKDESLFSRNGWNTAYLRVVGYHVYAELNGHKVADVTDEQHRYLEGKVGLQVHPGDNYRNMAIMMRECKIRPIVAEGDGGK